MHGRLHLGLVALLAVQALTNAAAAESSAPSVADVLTQAGLPADDAQRVLAGEFVERTGPALGARDLGIALVFLVKDRPAKFVEELMTGPSLLIAEDPGTLESGALAKEAESSTFSGLELSDAEKKLYAHVRPGEATNFSTKEIAALRSTDAANIEEALGRLLIDRYGAYRKSGLDGIPTYDRGGSRITDPADYLRRASQAARLVEQRQPAFHRILLEYPAARTPSFAESFHWIHYEANNTPAVVLMHFFSLSDGEDVFFGSREFYVSRGYNTEQAVGGFLAVREGTLVVYVDHVSTDLVTGFGGSARQAIGRKLMAKQLEGLFHKIRDEETRR